MTSVKANIYGRTPSKPQNFLTLEEVYGCTRLTIVDEDGVVTHCGNLISLSEEGLVLHECVSSENAESAGLPKSMFKDGRLKVLGFVPEEDVEEAKGPRVTPNRIRDLKYTCAVAKEDSLIVEEAGYGTPELTIGAKECGNSVYIRMSLTNIEDLYKRLGEHLAAVKED